MCEPDSPTARVLPVLASWEARVWAEGEGFEPSRSVNP